MNLEKKNSDNVCIHTKNVMSLININSNQLQNTELLSHVKNCPTCSKEYNLRKGQIEGLNIFIPRPLMDKELKETFDRELHELLVHFGLNDKANRERLAVTYLSTLNSYGETILKVLFSKSMLAAYACAGVMYLLLKQYF